MEWPDLGFAPPSALEFWGFVALVALGLSWIGLRIAWETTKERTDRRDLLRRTAALHANESGLTPEGAALFEKIVLATGLYPGLGAFERAVDRMLRAGVSPELLGSVRVKLGYTRPKTGSPLLSTRECAPGQDVTLATKQHVFAAGVLDVDETQILLKIPNDAVANLAGGMKVSVSFYRDFDARYSFATRVREVSGRPAPVVALNHPPRLNRVQDREHLRADVEWEIPVTRLSPDEYKRAVKLAAAPGRIESRPLRAKVLDISAGGFRLAPRADLSDGDHLVAEIPSSERKGALVALARVIASNEHGVRCAFQGVTTNERDEIHREILRERRKRGKI